MIVFKSLSQQKLVVILMQNLFDKISYNDSFVQEIKKIVHPNQIRDNNAAKHGQSTNFGFGKKSFGWFFAKLIHLVEAFSVFSYFFQILKQVGQKFSRKYFLRSF